MRVVWQRSNAGIAGATARRAQFTWRIAPITEATRRRARVRVCTNQNLLLRRFVFELLFELSAIRATP